MAFSRKSLFEKLEQPFDLIVIGGGITGAGIFLEATLAGLKVALFERQDFASGTSSRSSKLVHGGLRYLREGNFKLTYESVQEREWMLQALPGLVEPLPFLFPIYKGKGPSRLLAKLGLSLYDFFAGKSYHRYLSISQLKLHAPHLTEENLRGGYLFLDAKTDDARLVWRVTEEGVRGGGLALNYTEVSEIFRNHPGKVQGVCVKDLVNAEEKVVHAPVVINATGFMANQFAQSLPTSFRLRPLRGSHLILPPSRIPITHAVAAAHPQDGRLVFAIPWEGATLVGTTDLDHTEPLSEEPFCTEEEVNYLLAYLNFLFPSCDIHSDDILSTFAGVRAIISSGKSRASAESRDHLIIDNNGLITVTGGKLTTWRLIAKGTLKKVWSYLSARALPAKKNHERVYFPQIQEAYEACSTLLQKRLLGRYGKQTFSILSGADEQNFIPGTTTLWSELAWIAEHEMIIHLDDLLLRRTRLGLLLPDGGKALFPRLKETTHTLLGWDESKWQIEENRYLSLWRRAYQPKK